MDDAALYDALSDAIGIACADARFDELARALFARQYERNAPYRRFCDGRRATPETVTRWQEIPAAPAAAFKRFALTCTPESEAAAIFHSSGTTREQTSRHILDVWGLDLYRDSLHAGFEHFIPQETAGIVALMPPPAEAPHSSLSFMLGELGAEFFWPGRWPHQPTLYPEVAIGWLRVQRKPVTYFGTAFAWIHLLDALDAPLTLPEDTLIVETGGFKGRSREVSREELYGLFRSKLGVPDESCFSEYGMSEMASQLYGRGVNGAKYAPPWLKVRIVDPVTGQDAPFGQEGLIAFYDLANWNSVLALQTEDWGRLDPDGGLVLLGRAPGAILRGCSLTAEDLFAGG